MLKPDAGYAANTLGSSIEDFSLFGYFVKCLKNYANFKGRARRKEYWGYVLFYFIIYFLTSLIASVLVGAIMFVIYGHVPESVGSVSEGVAWGLRLPWVVPQMAVFVRRMHDIGRNGAWVWLWVAANICTVLVQKVSALKSSPIFAGIFWVLIFFSYLIIIFYSTRKGNAGENKYGSDPLAAMPRIPD